LTILFLVSLAVIALCILWLPTWSAALLLRRMDVPQPMRALRVVMPAQLLAVVLLIWLADAIGLGNPAGCSVAILLLASITGVVVVWRGRHGGV